MTLALLALLAALQTPVAGPDQTPELTAEIHRQDAAIFAALFDRCDVDALRGLVADDLEFVHDKRGVAATSGAQWLEGVAGMCRRQAEGTDYRAKRELVEGSDQVYPVRNYGAIHTGVHRFLAVSGEKKGQVLEVARFFNVWHHDGKAWRLRRVYSYDHRVD